MKVEMGIAECSGGLHGGLSRALSPSLSRSFGQARKSVTDSISGFSKSIEGL